MIEEGRLHTVPADATIGAASASSSARPSATAAAIASVSNKRTKSYASNSKITLPTQRFCEVHSTSSAESSTTSTSASWLLQKGSKNACNFPQTNGRTYYPAVVKA